MWGRFMKKTRGQKSHAIVPLRRNLQQRCIGHPQCTYFYKYYILVRVKKKEIFSASKIESQVELIYQTNEACAIVALNKVLYILHKYFRDGKILTTRQLGSRLCTYL